MSDERLRRMWRRVMLSALSASAPPARAWVLFSPYARSDAGYGEGGPPYWRTADMFDLRRTVLFWSMPDNPYDDEGLGGGLTWALHPSFCGTILPSFREEHYLFGSISFVSCDALRHAVDTAFATWAVNHRRIAFKDVTDECVQAGVSARCPGAEVTLHTVPFRGQWEDAAAYVEHDLKDVDRAPRTTRGRRAVGSVGMRHSSLKLSSAHCWYLDATFCTFMSRAPRDVTRIVLAAVFCVSLLAAFVFVIDVLRAWSKLHTHCELWAACAKRVLRIGARVGHFITLGTAGSTRPSEPAASSSEVDRSRVSGTLRHGALVEYLASVPVGPLLLGLFGLVFSPVFYQSVYLPCVECHGFEATLAHEIGHVLGFHHPDTKQLLNLRGLPNTTRSDPLELLDPSASPYAYLRNSEMAAGAQDPIKGCEEPVEPLVAVELSSVSPSDTFMNSIATARPSTCLTDDDLDGLRHLYPPCHRDDVPLRPVCVKPIRRTGYLRLLLALAVPYAFSTAFLLGVLGIVRACQRRHVQRLREDRRRRRHQSMWWHAAARANWAVRASRASRAAAPRASVSSGSLNAVAAGARDARRGANRLLTRQLTTVCGSVMRAREQHGTPGAARSLVRLLFASPEQGGRTAQAARAAQRERQRREAEQAALEQQRLVEMRRMVARTREEPYAAAPPPSQQLPPQQRPRLPARAAPRAAPARAPARAAPRAPRPPLVPVGARAPEAGRAFAPAYSKRDMDERAFDACGHVREGAIREGPGRHTPLLSRRGIAPGAASSTTAPPEMPPVPRGTHSAAPEASAATTASSSLRV